MEKDEQHLVMFPWLAFGHLIPFYQLSIALAKSGFNISFISTPKNIRRLSKPPLEVMNHLTMISLPLPHVDGLEENAEATVDLPTSDDQYLKKAFDLLRNPFERFVADKSPNWIVHDFLNPWASEVGLQLGIPSMIFSIYSASTLAFLGLGEEPVCIEEPTKHWPSACALRSPPAWLAAMSSIRCLPHEAEGFFNRGFAPNTSGISDVERFALAAKLCKVIAIRSSYEFEGEYLKVLTKSSKPMFPIGLLPPKRTTGPPTATATTGDGGRGEWEEIFQWLDSKEPKSVVFVGFGSECKLGENQIRELSHGLEMSKLDFLWALRRPAWAGDDDSKILPPGFLDRVAGRGIVRLGWAPQMEILAHPSIGGSLFHSGWASIIETVQFGHVLVVLPFVDGQGLNARQVVEEGLALEIEREEDGSFHREDVAKALRKAMMDEPGQSLRKRSRELMAHFGDQTVHLKYIDGFVDFLMSHAKQM